MYKSGVTCHAYLPKPYLPVTYYIIRIPYLSRTLRSVSFSILTRPRFARSLNIRCPISPTFGNGGTDVSAVGPRLVPHGRVESRLRPRSQIPGPFPGRESGGAAGGHPCFTCPQDFPLHRSMAANTTRATGHPRDSYDNNIHAVQICP